MNIIKEIVRRDWGKQRNTTFYYLFGSIGDFGLPAGVIIGIIFQIWWAVAVSVVGGIFLIRLAEYYLNKD